MNDETTDNLTELMEKAKDEPVASFLNMTVETLEPGRAKVSMTLLPSHVNFNGMVFGGIIMSIADQAFAYATNALVSPSIASQFNIHFAAGAAVGDDLTAECRVVKGGGTIGISEITVTNQNGKLIAKATGTTVSPPHLRSNGSKDGCSDV